MTPPFLTFCLTPSLRRGLMLAALATGLGLLGFECSAQALAEQAPALSPRPLGPALAVDMPAWRDALLGAQVMALLLALVSFVKTRQRVYAGLLGYLAVSALLAFSLPAARQDAAVWQALQALQWVAALQLGLWLPGLPWPAHQRHGLQALMALPLAVAALAWHPPWQAWSAAVLPWLEAALAGGLLALSAPRALQAEQASWGKLAAWALLLLALQVADRLFAWAPADLAWWSHHNATLSLALQLLGVMACFAHRQVLSSQLDRDRLSDQLEAHVERLKREELGQFLIMFGHEVRTPLAVIDSATQTLEMLPGADSPLLRQRHQRIRSAVKRLDSLANEALSRERRETVRQAVRMRPVNWAELLTELLAMHSSALILPELSDGLELPVTIGDCADGRLRLELPQGWPALMADAELLHFALSNLLDNARKYGHAHTTVTLRLESGPGQDHESHLRLVRCSVTSEGPALTRSELAQVFQKYWRRHASGPVGGAGLGLHLVQTIASLHRGRVEAQSLAGNRTCFTLIFQGTEEAARSPAAAPALGLGEALASLQAA